MTQDMYPFPRKSRRCRHYEEDGWPISGDECQAHDCYFAHPKDPEWATSTSTSTNTSRFRPPPPLPDRRDSLFSRRIDRSRDRSRERRRGYSPGPWSRSKENLKERDRGWDGINRKREQERRKSPPRDSFVSSRQSAKDSAQTKYGRISIDTAIPSEPTTHHSPLQRKLTASKMDANAAPDPAPKRVNIDANLPPRPPSATPSPIPLRLEPSSAVSSSSSFSTFSQQHSHKPHDQRLGSSSGGFIVPSLPSSAAEASTSSSHSVGQSKRHGLGENRAPIIVLPSNPTLSVSAGATPAGTPNIVTPIKVATNDTTHPEIADVEMAPLDQTADIPISTMNEVSSSIWDTLSTAARPRNEAISRPQQNQEQGQDVSQSLQPTLSLPPLLPLPPLPSFELVQTTSGLSQEAKFDLWNKRIKIIAEVLVHHNKVVKLTSDIDDLSRYASSSYFASDSNSRFDDDREAKEQKKRIENDLSELTTARDTAKRTIQKLYSVLTESDMWPSPPAIEDMQKQNMRVGEYVKALVDVMNKVAEDLTDLRRSLDERKKGKVRNKEKVQHTVKEQEQDTNMMDVDVEDSHAPITTPNAHQPTIVETNVKFGVSEAESVDTESKPSYPNTRHCYQELQSRIHTLSEQVDTLQSTLDETESTWLQGTQDLYSSLLSKHKSSLAKYRDSFKTSLSPYVSSVKASLDQLSSDATNISRKLDQAIQEETRLSEETVKLEEERDRLRKGQKKFFEEELPELKKKFEEYDKERERDAKRVSVLEVALKAFEKRTPGLHATSTEVAAAVPTTASAPMPAFTLKPGDQILSLHEHDSTSFQSSPSSQEPQSSIMNLLQPRLKDYIREQVKPIIEGVKNQVETMVNNQREDMRVTTWAKMDLTYKVLDEIGKRVGVDMAAENESAGANEQGERGGTGSSMDLDR